MDTAAVRRAVELAGLSPLPDDVEFSVVGSDPVHPSPHHLGEGAAVARLVTGAAANELWRTRTGRSQRLEVDVGSAAASLLSFLYFAALDPTRQLSLVGSDPGPLYGIFATADGRHIQMHPSFSDGPRIFGVLGLGHDASPEEISGAIGRRQAFELEAALVDAHLCGGVVLSQAEWAAHPQGRAVAGEPVVRITKMGEAPPEPFPDGDRPAAGVRVLDLTRVLAGPTVAKTIAEHGADVLHVTSPNHPVIELFEVDTGIGKRQASIDLDTPDGAATMRDLLRASDVFSQGYRLGALDRRGFGPTQAAALRPGIVYVSENCYGHAGPWAHRPGWEQLAQAATGMSHREGQDTGTPRIAPAAVNDYTTGFFGAFGAMTALARRAVEGGSWHVEVSLSQTASWYQRLGDDLDPAAAVPVNVDPFFVELDSDDFGPIRYLAPALRMDETPPRWDLPPARPGAHDAAWLP